MHEPLRRHDRGSLHLVAPPDPAVPATAHRDLVESYRRLAEVFHDVLSEQSLDAVLQRIADTLAELVPYEALHVYEADEGKRELAPQLVRSEYAEAILGAPFPFGEGITGWAVDHREPVLSNRAHLDPRVRFVPGTPIEPEALICVPLLARGTLKGTLNVYRIGEDAAFSPEEFELACRFGDAAALALDNAHVRAHLEHQAQTDSLTGLYNHRAFHERLRSELTRASALHDEVALIMLDIDDFKKVNDVYGHGVGDQILRQLADLLRATVRTGDVACRIGGEEFAVIVPSAGESHSLALATRLADRLDAVEFELAGRVRVSVGIAHGPQHAANPRELVACAEAAMMAAKARGKNQVVLFDESAGERPGDGSVGHDDVRSIAHLKLLQSVAGKLNRLSDVRRIGETIADELRGLIDYHNCRVFVRDGDLLHAVTFRGELTSERPASEVLETRVGEGITGRVAATGEPLVVPDAARCEFAVRLPGTEELEESLLAVPLNYGSRTNGVIVVSKLGLEQFDADDLRLLEVLAGHAAVAVENASLYEAQRREAESAKALLEFGRDLARAEGLEAVAARVVAGSARMLGSPGASLWLVDEGSDELCAISFAGDNAPRIGRFPAAAVPDTTEPFIVRPDDYAVLSADRGAFAIAPFTIGDRVGLIAAAEPAAGFNAGDLDLLGGLAHQAKLAIASASSYASLERTFLSTVEALANALEASDEYTSSHARWISDMAILVGRELGLDAAQLKRVELGALFHDIGKIGIPSGILSKPGPLDASEREVIEQHPALGERILRPIHQLEDVCPIVRAGHERYDGKGYPDGLAGEDIPVESRIIFACDAFHAMTTDRPYRGRLPVEEARRRLAEAAGSQFDPRVVEVCLHLLEAPPE